MANLPESQGAGQLPRLRAVSCKLEYLIAPRFDPASATLAAPVDGSLAIVTGRRAGAATLALTIISSIANIRSYTGSNVLEQTGNSCRYLR
jgi:hypothetical protein